jgi:hypothetical protein
MSLLEQAVTDLERSLVEFERCLGIRLREEAKQYDDLMTEHHQLQTSYQELSQAVEKVSDRLQKQIKKIEDICGAA